MNDLALLLSGRRRGFAVGGLLALLLLEAVDGRVRLVEVAGNQTIHGGNGVAQGAVHEANRLSALKSLGEQKFGNANSDR